jgi:hypothetical protein
MREGPRPGRWLFGGCCALAVLLLGLVVLAPLLDEGDPAPAGAQRVVALFARDHTLRRTSLASAAGLVVTACVFFHPGSNPPTQGARRSRSSGIAGA